MVSASVCTAAVGLSSSLAVSGEESSSTEVVLQGRLKNSESLKNLDYMLANLD